MAQRISEQVVEWLTVGGDSFTPNNLDDTNSRYIPLVVNRHGSYTATLPATGGTAIGIYNNQGQIWTLGAVAATKNVKSSQLIISSSDADGGSGAGIELWRGTNTSWQILGSSGTDGILYIGNNYATTNQATYETNMSMRYGAVADQYVRIHATKDSNYAHSATGAALIVDGGATFAKKVYIASSQDVDTNYNSMLGAFTVEGGSTFNGKIFIFNSTDSNYSTKAGSLVSAGGAYFAKKVYIADTTDSAYNKTGSFATEGGGYFGKKVYLADTTDSNYVTKAGALVVEGGANFAKKVYLRDSTDSNYATIAGSLVTAGGLFVTKKTYIADATDSNYSTLAGALVVVGGANFGKKVYLKDATDSTSYTTGSLVTAGGMAITKQLRVQGVTTHGGNVVSDTNATDNIGVTATRWKEGYFSGLLNVGAASTSYNTTSSHNSYISPGSFYSNVHSAAGGFFVYLDNVEYGRLYIPTKGTAPTATTNEETGETTYSGYAQGYTQLTLGNNKVGANSASGVVNNSRGRIRIYGASANYTDLLSNPNGNRTVYLPYYAGDMYLVHGGSATTAIGGARKPVYVAANGRVTVGDIEFDTLNANRLVWTNAANKIYAGYHYADSTHVAIASSTAPSTNFFVSGSSEFKLGSSNSTSAAVTLTNGLLKITNYGNTVTIGSQNTTWCHIYNSASIPFIFNNTVAQTTGNLGTDTYPWGTFYWKGLSYVRTNRSRYSYDLILQNGAGNTFGEFWYDRGNATNITMGSWRFREYSPNSTADTATTGYYEDFYLPNVTSGRTANAAYNIITTKNPGDLYWANVKVSASSNTGTAPTFAGMTVTKSGEPGILLSRSDYSPNHSAYMYVQAMGANNPSSLMFYVANAAGTRSSTFALDGEYGIILVSKSYSGSLPSSGGRTGRLYFKTIST